MCFPQDPLVFLRMGFLWWWWSNFKVKQTKIHLHQCNVLNYPWILHGIYIAAGNSRRFLPQYDAKSVWPSSSMHSSPFSSGELSSIFRLNFSLLAHFFSLCGTGIVPVTGRCLSDGGTWYHSKPSRLILSSHEQSVVNRHLVFPQQRPLKLS